MDERNQPFLKEICKGLAPRFQITKGEDLLILAEDVKDAAADALDYCNRDVLVGNMASAVKDLYIFRRNISGNEGETSRTEGGVSQTFEIGIPAKIRSKLNRYRVAKVRSFL